MHPETPQALDFTGLVACQKLFFPNTYFPYFYCKQLFVELNCESSVVILI